MSNKLWSKGFEPDKMIEEFTVGNDRALDLRIAKHDVQGSLAHVKMLESIGLLNEEELAVLVPALEQIALEIQNGKFEIKPGVEDVHSQVEFILTERLGDVGKKIHSGRSRNDQVLVDLKLMLREDLLFTTKSLKNLFQLLVAQADKFKHCLMPGYTHLQVAMPSSFGLWLSAYAESFCDDLRFLVAAYDTANQNPLGSAAGYGSSFPLDRELTTRLLGFADMHINSVAAQMSRGKTERAVAMAYASIASTLGRLAMDVCMWMCQNFSFLTFPDELTTGSSIMPHKKNPDVFEIMRGKCNRLQAIPNEIALLTDNLPLGYNRDLQLLKDIIFPAGDELRSCLDMASFMLSKLEVKENILDDPRYDCLFTVEEVNRRVLDGTPFREAYRQVGMEVREGTFIPRKELNHSHIGSIGNLRLDLITKKFHKIYNNLE